MKDGNGGISRPRCLSSFSENRNGVIEMGRMLRIALAEGVSEAIDLGIVGPGKILLYNTGTNDIRVGYDRSDVSTTGTNYFTLLGGSQYIFDVGPGIGFLSQNQQLYFVSPTSDQTLEIWIADNQ